jgi:hypothetical protein
MKDRFGFDWTNVAGTHFWKRPQLGRRLFFRHLASAIGGYFLMPSRPMETVAHAKASPMGTAKNCIFILMGGAPSHVDTFDLKEGPWLPAATNPTSYDDIRWPQGLLPKLADQLDSIAFVRSIKPWAAVHGLAQTWLQIGRNPTSAMARIAPHIGSIASLELGGPAASRLLPAFVSLNATTGPGEGYFSPDHAPFYVTPGGGGLGNTAHRDGQAVFERRFGLLTQLDGPMRESGELGAAVEQMEAFNLGARRMMYNPTINGVFTFDAAERARYGNTGFGNACITARNLLRANLGTRFIQITIGGWDNHAGIYTGALNPSNQNSLGHQFDNGLGTLIADLRNDNLLDDTLIVAMGEFGRTVGPLNAGAGRDHHVQQSALFAGGRIRGKRAVGSTDDVGRFTADPGWSRERDIRTEDVEATIYSALGIDWTKILRDDPTGRGFEYVPFADRDLYGPVHELWG